jgi:murein DD-endopeptidase MepM/ murein hydrolase activator NlpD
MMRAILVLAISMVAPSILYAQDFTYQPPGALVSGSGTGRADDTVYVPGMRFPIEVAPAYPNSQVWGVGGLYGPSGSQCNTANYSYPWYDNFCESRTWAMPLCPTSEGHQGQDIRPSTCADDTHWSVAAEDGTITSIGSYSVYLMADSGTLHRYLHMAPRSIPVTAGTRVSRGDRLGRVSNAFGGTPTTYHLHYDLYQNVAGVGGTYVPTYMSLVRSYEELLGREAEPCFVMPPEGGVLDDAGPCFQRYGPPTYWRPVDDGYDGAMLWTNASDGTRPGNWARWVVHLAEAGTYEVEVNVVAPYNRSTAVRYLVRHAGTDTEVVLDQSAGAGWRSLGEFMFAEGDDQRIEVYDNTGETGPDLHITVDAVRLSTEPVDIDAGTGDDIDAGIRDDIDAGMREEPDGGPHPTDAGARDEPETLWLRGGCSCDVGPRSGMALPLSVGALWFFLRRRGRRSSGRASRVASRARF